MPELYVTTKTDRLPFGFGRVIDPADDYLYATVKWIINNGLPEKVRLADLRVVKRAVAHKLLDEVGLLGERALKECSDGR